MSQPPHRIGAAILGFRNHYGCLPPRAIVDESGKPLLSWRVLLLPYLGYSKLFHLLRLDEPWDSQHNRKLIPYMPLIYNSTQAGLPFGRTTFEAVTGAHTAFPDNGLRRFHDFDKDPADVLLIVEVDKKNCVEWTKPADVARTDDKSWRDGLFQKENHFRGIYGDALFRVFRIDDAKK